MTRTLANSSQSLYMGLLDEAYMKVRSGSFSYEQAIADTVTDCLLYTSYLQIVKRIEELYEKANADGFYSWGGSSMKEFDRLVSNMPQEAWIQ